MQLLECRIPPGTRIPETSLCEDFGISRTPLREALKVLAAEGLVDLLPHRGAVAAAVTVEETADLFEVMTSLEGLVGRLAVETGSETAVDEVAELHQRMAGFHARRRRADYFRVNQQIHFRLAAMTGNAVLEPLYRNLARRVERARYLANMSRVRWDESMREHERIMDQLRARDASGLSRTLSDHAARTGDAVVGALQAMPVRGNGRR